MEVNSGTEYILLIYSTSEYTSLLKKYFHLNWNKKRREQKRPTTAREC